jgi:hypothetical protein
MSNKSIATIATMGIDLGKNSFHVVGLDRRGAIVLRQKWSRGQIEARLAGESQRPSNAPPALPQSGPRRPLNVITNCRCHWGSCANLEIRSRASSEPRSLALSYQVRASARLGMIPSRRRNPPSTRGS